MILLKGSAMCDLQNNAARMALSSNELKLFLPKNIFSPLLLSADDFFGLEIN